MNRIAEFEKVSPEQFLKDWTETFPECSSEEAEKIYDEIILPRRATAGSAGYDFFAPCSFSLAPGTQILIPTGIRVKIDEGFVLMLFPRSSLGFRYRLQMNNTAGIIDSDYYNAKNEGHIFCKLANDSFEGRTALLEKGTGMIQGIFVPFGITVSDSADTVRTGGIGSTTKEQENRNDHE